MQTVELAVIGGSGLYHMTELTEVEEVDLLTPFGKPSDRITVGTLYGRRVAFLPRHGRRHHLNPTEVPYRANIYALKSLGAKYLLSVSACGSLREEFAPGHIVIPDQIYDNTKGQRAHSFFSGGIVAHVGVAHPFSPELSRVVVQATRAVGGTVHEGGTFITVEGPRFSTRGESLLYRQWGMSIIGMTTCPEVFLAAEAEMAYVCMAHVTDYDVWHESEGPVTVDTVIRVMHHNTELARKVILYMVEHMAEWEGDFPAHHTLQEAIITHKEAIDLSTQELLRPFVSKYLNETQVVATTTDVAISLRDA